VGIKLRVEKDLSRRIHQTTQVRHHSDSKEWLFTVCCLLLLLLLLLCKWIEAALRRAACFLRGKLAVLRLAKPIGYTSKQALERKKSIAYRSAPTFPNVSTPSPSRAANRLAKCACSWSVRVWLRCTADCGDGAGAGAGCDGVAKSWRRGGSWDSYVEGREKLEREDCDGGWGDGAGDADDAVTANGLFELSDRSSVSRKT
jgi:hypothetical protein